MQGDKKDIKETLIVYVNGFILFFAFVRFIYVYRSSVRSSLFHRSYRCRKLNPIQTTLSLSTAWHYVKMFVKLVSTLCTPSSPVGALW